MGIKIVLFVLDVVEGITLDVVDLIGKFVVLNGLTILEGIILDIVLLEIFGFLKVYL